MTELTESIRVLYEREMTAAAGADEAQARWAHLERAHIVSQPYPWLHTRNHVAMFRLALRQHDRREALATIRGIIEASGAPGDAPAARLQRVSALFGLGPELVTLAPSSGRKAS